MRCTTLINKYISIIGIVIVSLCVYVLAQTHTTANLDTNNVFTGQNSFASPLTLTGLTNGCLNIASSIIGSTANPCGIVGPQYAKLRCETGLGDGLNAMTAGTYLQSFCYNDSGVTWTITGIKCFTDNNGTSTLNAAGNTLGALLTGAVTCTNAFAAGTQSANVLLTSGDYVKFTFVADGTSKQTTFVVSMTQ